MTFDPASTKALRVDVARFVGSLQILTVGMSIKRSSWWILVGNFDVAKTLFPKNISITFHVTEALLIEDLQPSEEILTKLLTCP